MHFDRQFHFILGAGFKLLIAGFATGLLGEKAAMACSDAVEESIVEHYNE